MVLFGWRARERGAVSLFPRGGGGGGEPRIRQIEVYPPRGGGSSSRRWSVGAGRDKRVVCAAFDAQALCKIGRWWGGGDVPDPPTGQTTP